MPPSAVARDHARVDGRPDAPAAPDARPWWIASDVHLGAVPPETATAFHVFVAAAVEATAGLLINGDLFDYWLTDDVPRAAWRRGVPHPYRETVEVLREAVQAGLRLVVLEGNRDPLAWDRGRVLADVVGAETHRGPVRLSLAGWETLVTHGDRVPGATPRLTRWLRTRVLQRPSIVRGAQVVIGTERIVGALLAHSGTRRSVAENARRRRTGEPPAPRPPAVPIRRWAEAMLAADRSLQLVLAGHSHAPEVREVAPGQYYANTGDWIDGWHFVELRPRTAPGARPRLLAWPSRAELAGTRWDAAPVAAPVHEPVDGPERRTVSDGAHGRDAAQHAPRAGTSASETPRPTVSVR